MITDEKLQFYAAAASDTNLIRDPEMYPVEQRGNEAQADETPRP